MIIGADIKFNCEILWIMVRNFDFYSFQVCFYTITKLLKWIQIDEKFVNLFSISYLSFLLTFSRWLKDLQGNYFFCEWKYWKYIYLYMSNTTWDYITTYASLYLICNMMQSFNHVIQLHVYVHVRFPDIWKPPHENSG